MHALAWLGLLAVVPLLAGCFGGPPEDAEEDTVRPQVTTVVGQTPPPATTTLLHFLPRFFTTDEPSQSEPFRVAIPSLQSVATGEARSPDWNFTWPTDARSVHGNLTLLIDVQGVVLNPPAALSSTGTSCFLQISVQVLDPAQTTPQEGSGGSDILCMEAPVVVPTGTHALTLPFMLPDSRYAVGFGCRAVAAARTRAATCSTSSTW